ncbi:MAG: hypothetical protein K2X84_01865, partial [Beijerinckiaceae bacterium]|nr:hypothetical protein [Beijerinckiaceae bacterium]
MVTYVGTLGDDIHAGSETVQYGLDGNDQLSYNTIGTAILYGGEGDDQLRYAAGPESGGTAYGGSGNDTIEANFLAFH